MKIRQKNQWWLVVFMLLAATLLQAQEESTTRLAKESQNLITKVMSFPFQNNTSFEIGPFDRNANVLNFQPVIPFANGNVLTLTNIPIVWQPNIMRDSGTSTGLGDIQLAVMHSLPSKGFQWGIGPVLALPTGGESRGTEKWSGGAMLGVLVMPGQWVTGFLIQNVWSFAGDEQRADVNAMVLKPFLSYNFGQSGWFITSAPIIIANWKATSGNKWIVPLGATVGKLNRVGSKGLPIIIQVGAFYNVVNPDFGPNWSARVQLAIMLPKSIFQSGKK